MASRSTLRRRRRRAGLWRIAWELRACRIGFIAGFIAGMALVAGLSHSDSRGIAPAMAAAAAGRSVATLE